jgi:hypothetical protein
LLTRRVERHPAMPLCRVFKCEPNSAARRRASCGGFDRRRRRRRLLDRPSRSSPRLRAPHTRHDRPFPPSQPNSGQSRPSSDPSNGNCAGWRCTEFRRDTGELPSRCFRGGSQRPMKRAICLSGAGGAEWATGTAERRTGFPACAPHPPVACRSGYSTTRSAARLPRSHGGRGRRRKCGPADAGLVGGRDFSRSWWSPPSP